MSSIASKDASVKLVRNQSIKGKEKTQWTDVSAAASAIDSAAAAATSAVDADAESAPTTELPVIRVSRGEEMF